MSTRGTPMVYFQSLNRPFLLFGIKKEMFFLSIALSFPLAWSARLTNFWMDALAVVVFTIAYSISLLMTRADVDMVKYYLRHIRYKRYYSAQPTVHSVQPPISDSVPVYQGKGGLV